MIDKREQILLRLRAILGTLVGPVYRNRGESNDRKILPPVAFLLDGVERKVGEPKTGRPGPIPYLMELVPQIYIILKPKVLENAEEYGPEMSALRMRVLTAITKDATLLGLCGPEGRIDYRGMDTDMQTGRSMEGQLQFNFAFRYILHPSDL